MFDPEAAYRIIGEPFEGLSRTEIEERTALNQEFMAWIAERKARFVSVVAAREAGR